MAAFNCSLSAGHTLALGRKSVYINNNNNDYNNNTVIIIIIIVTRGAEKAHLCGGHEDVEHAEVLLKAVANEDGARVDQVAQFEVGRLVGGQVVARLRRVQVTWHLPRQLYDSALTHPVFLSSLQLILLLLHSVHVRSSPSFATGACSALMPASLLL